MTIDKTIACNCLTDDLRVKQMVADVIRDHIKPAELLDEPLWDGEQKEWRALVAVTPWGPLLLMGFKLRVEGIT